MTQHYPPRILRPPDAAYYCGMGKTLFDREIRPHLTEINLGNQGIGFDRIDLDTVIDDYKSRNAKVRETKQWQNEPGSQGYTGTKKQEKVASTSASTESAEFGTALQQALSKKPKANTGGSSTKPKTMRHSAA